VDEQNADAAPAPEERAAAEPEAVAERPAAAEAPPAYWREADAPIGQLFEPEPPVQSAAPARAAWPSHGAARALYAGASPGEISVEGALWVPAGFWLRLGAFVIDFLLLVLLHALALRIAGVRAPSSEQMMDLLGKLGTELLRGGAASGLTGQLKELEGQLRFYGWVNLALCASYFTVLHGMLGATLGKLALGLRVMRRNGQPLGLAWAFLRYLGYLVLAKLLYGVWTMPFSREKQTAYDIVLGTNVFRRVR
jgi:uncharacterized RDD family membrane protein YckC